MRDTQFTIVKALAILCVVLSHAGISGWLFNFVFIFHVPVFFLCAGYFFRTKYLTDERTFIVHRVRGLYVPFLKWSVFFLVVHNLLFHIGLLSETYGNAAGGVTHPYTWHQFSQHLWSIVFNMSGYDQFLCGAFWFFRALLLASIGFLLLFKLLRRTEKLRDDTQVGWAVLAIGLLLTAWKVGEGLTVTGVAQGGYRELMGLTFMAAGFLLRRYDAALRYGWRLALPAFAVLLLASFFFPSSMAWNPTFTQILSLPVPAVCGFLTLVYVAGLINRKPNVFSRALAYIGDHTLHIFAFHLLAFKVVSALKVAWYGLPWEAVGSHPTITQPANNALWVLLYLIVGTGLPLLWLAGYRRISARVHLTERQVLDGCVFGLRLCGRVLFRLGRALVRLAVRLWHNFVQAVKAIIAASSTKDE